MVAAGNRGNKDKSALRIRAVQKWRVALGALVLAFLALVGYCLYRIACYEARVCPGDLQLYTTHFALAILALYALAVIHIIVTKFLKK